MTSKTVPLIVGAGPVGLAAALFLTRQGQAVRVVEMLSEPSRQSRALAINPRTLEILEPTGITRQMLELGLPIQGVSLHRKEKLFATMSLAGIHPKYPFMLALSQASSERLLARALERAGGMVDRMIKMVDCRTSADGVVAILEPTNGGVQEIFECPWLLAADGAHSTVREKLNSSFPGSSLEEEWYLADAPLRTKLPADQGHVFLFDSGRFLFMIRVVDETIKDQPGALLWRVITNRPEPLNQLVEAEQAGPAFWESGFHISHRIVDKMATSGVYFAGDAAHLHSPIGARGMNLGLEDAWVFAQLMKEGRISEYDALRRPVDNRVVRRVELLTRMIAAQSPFSRVARRIAFPVVVKTPILRGKMLNAVTGLDHALPDLLTSSRSV